eukprot:TRINITY_DN2606_c0_g1_i3.p1 TRINITY_DN2606_c0_g1~~TRINITY_DN2606_c0_g1_i3.p1  ORF type:complete len:368 (+),score=28.28 TRINITY_DN2606_c0_g1_i3:65-1168(+)
MCIRDSQKSIEYTNQFIRSFFEHRNSSYDHASRLDEMDDHMENSRFKPTENSPVHSSKELSSFATSKGVNNRNYQSDIKPKTIKTSSNKKKLHFQDEFSPLDSEEDASPNVERLENSTPQSFWRHKPQLEEHELSNYVGDSDFFESCTKGQLSVKSQNENEVESKMNIKARFKKLYPKTLAAMSQSSFSNLQNPMKSIKAPYSKMFNRNETSNSIDFNKGITGGRDSKEMEHYETNHMLLIFEKDTQINNFTTREDFVRESSRIMNRIEELNTTLKEQTQAEFDRIYREFIYKDYAIRFNTSIEIVLAALIGAARAQTALHTMRVFQYISCLHDLSISFIINLQGSQFHSLSCVSSLIISDNVLNLL